MKPNDIQTSPPCLDIRDAVHFAMWFRDIDPKWDTDAMCWMVPIEQDDIDLDLQPHDTKGYSDEELFREYLRTTL